MSHPNDNRFLEKEAIRRAIRRYTRTPEEKAALRSAWFAKFGDDNQAVTEARQQLLKKQIAEHRILEHRAARRAAAAQDKAFWTAWEETEPLPTTYTQAVQQGNIDHFIVELTPVQEVVSQPEPVYLEDVVGVSNSTADLIHVEWD